LSRTTRTEGQGDSFLASAEHRREAITMALYVSISLISVMIALPSELSPDEAERPALAVFLTSIGLMLAHALAFRISARLAHGQLPSHVVAVLLAQLAGGLAVTVVAVAPILVVGGSAGVRLAEYLLIAFVGTTAYAAARASSMSRLRSTVYATLIVMLALVVLWVKALTPH
jgi:hypothetical protein